MYIELETKRRMYDEGTREFSWHGDTLGGCIAPRLRKFYRTQAYIHVYIHIYVLCIFIILAHGTFKPSLSHHARADTAIYFIIHTYTYLY